MQVKLDIPPVGLDENVDSSDTETTENVNIDDGAKEIGVQTEPEARPTFVDAATQTSAVEVLSSLFTYKQIPKVYYASSLSLGYFIRNLMFQTLYAF